MNRKALINKIKDKKEFRDLDSGFVEQILEHVLASKIEDELNKKEIEKVVKETRAKLREVYGAFISKNFNRRYRYLADLKSLKDIEGHEKILKLHTSTRERLPYYDEIYEKIFKITKKPKTILDLGCGLNPFSIPFLSCKPKYFAVELVKKDVEFIQSYFDKFKIKGKTLQIDLVDFEEDMPEADICFLFKMLDTLETLKWDITDALLKRLKVKWIIVSFSTKSLGGKKAIGKRTWFEKLIKDFKYEVFSVSNEVFYVIRHKQ